MSAAERIEALRARNPGAVELATAISLAARAEPELLRHARLAVGADATAEADLWWSDLVASQNASGIMLDPAVADELRQRLAERPELLARCWELTRDQHAEEHLSVRLEELINWLSVAGEPDAAERVEELLVAGAHEWMATAAEPAGGVRWLLGALRRFPPLAARSPAGTAIAAAAASRAGHPPELAELPPDALENWFPWLLARLPSAWLRVALVDGGIEFEGPEGERFEAPDTDPVTLSLTWHDGAPRRRQVTVRRGERTTVALEADEVQLTTLAGRRFTVRRRGAHAGGLDFSAVRAAHRPASGLGPVVAEIVERAGGGGWGEIGGAAGAGKTTALCAALDVLEAEGVVVAQHFFGRGPRWWDQRDTVRRSLVAQLRAAVAGLPEAGSVERELEELLALAAQRADAPGVVVALDDPPAAGREELRRRLSEWGFPSLLPPRVAFIVASRWAGAVRDWLEDGDPYWRVELKGDAGEAGRAYVGSLWAPLLRALGPVRVALADAATVSLLREDIERLGFTTDGSPADCAAAVVVVAEHAPAPVGFVRLCQALGVPLVVVGYSVGFERAVELLGPVDARLFLPGPDGLGARLQELTWPVVAPLFELAAGSIERLRRIVDWIVTRPAGSVQLDRLPASLLGPLPAELAPELVGLIAAARPGFTLADLLWMTPVEEWERTLAGLHGLQQANLLAEPLPPAVTGAALGGVTLAGPSAALGSPLGGVTLGGGPSAALEDPARLIAEHGATPLVSADPRLADALPREAVADAHRRLAETAEVNPGVAPPYFARNEVAHAVATGDPELVERVCESAALTRRARRAGLAALAADLELAQTVIDIAPVRDAVLALAARGADAADFPRLLFHELHARGSPLAERYRHPHSALQPLLAPWPDVTAARRPALDEVDAIAAVGNQLAAVRLGAVLVGGPGGFSPAEWALRGGATALAAGDDVVAAALGGALLTVSSRTGQRVYDDLAADRLFTAGGGVLAAAGDGALTFVPTSDQPPRTLLGHTAALTAAATLNDPVPAPAPTVQPPPPPLPGDPPPDRPISKSALYASEWPPPAPPGPRFATASLDGTVAVWPPAGSSPLVRYRGHGAPVRAVTALRNGVVSGGDDGTLRLWSPDDGHDLAVLSVGSPVTACATWQDQVAWGAANGSMGLWDPYEPERSQRLDGHGGRVLGIEVQSDRLVSWAADGTVAVQSAQGRALLRGPAPARRAQVVSGGSIAVLWGDGTVTYEDDTPLDARGLRCLAVAGEQVAYGDGIHVVVTSRTGGEERRPQRAAPIMCVFLRGAPVAVNEFDGIVALASASDLLYVALRDGSIDVRRTLAGSMNQVMRDPEAGPILSLAADIDYVLSGHANGAVRLWRDGAVHRAYEQDRPAAHVALARTAYFSADGATIRAWDLRTDEASVLGTHDAEITGLAALDGDRLASCAQDGTLRLWSIDTGALAEAYRAPLPLVALAADGPTLAARDAGGRLYVWDTPLISAQQPVTVEPGHTVLGEDFELISSDAQVAIDRPPGFWDDRTPEGRFAVPPLVRAGRSFEVRVDGPPRAVTFTARSQFPRFTPA